MRSAHSQRCLMLQSQVSRYALQEQVQSERQQRKIFHLTQNWNEAWDPVDWGDDECERHAQEHFVADRGAWVTHETPGQTTAAQ